MTDNTQREAVSTHIIRLALELGLLWIDGDGRGKVREALDALDTLEAQLEAAGAGGAQALSAAPEAIAKLRHLYQNMVNGAVRDTASAKRIAEGLLAPAIEALERATPPAEQQAAPKAAPGESGWWRKRADEIEVQVALTGSPEAMRCFTDMRTLLQAATDAAPAMVNRTQHNQFLSDVLTAAGLVTHGKQCKALGERLGAMVMRLRAAPQQEVQEPAAFIHWPINGPPRLVWYSQKALNDAILKTHEDGYKPDVKLYTAPQPAPAPLSEMPYEKRKAIQEGASDAWFHARHNMLDTLDRRNVFRAGFDRGWNAAIAAQGGK